ncbi:MAG: cyclic nucleotide-binding domain-containing protein [Legionellales bacterium]|nr:cyclic nucleotide-binding domain-containing protein [Legionellales bacterium]
MEKSTQALFLDTLKLFGVGLFNGLIIIIITLPLGLLVLPGTLSIYASYGVTLALLSTTLSCLLISMTSELKSAVSRTQNTSVAVLLLANVAIADKIALLFPHDSPLPTLLVGIMLSGLVVGIFLYFLGKFNLGNLFRYIPYTVIGGFLAGTGWLILKGCWPILTNIALTSGNLTVLLSKPILIQWIPGLFVGLTLCLLTRFSRKIYYPYLFFFCVFLLFYITLFATHTSLAEARSMGLLFGNVSPVSLMTLYHGFDFSAVHWSVLMDQSFYLLLLVLLTTVGLLLNTSSVEVLTKKNIDFNRELKTNGLATAISSALGGGFVGYPTLSLCIMNQRIAKESRIIGITAGFTCLAMLLFGTFVLNSMPRFPFAGFLIALGLEFLISWLYDIWFKLNAWDCSIILIIFAFIVFEGFLSGFIVGLLVSSVFFSLKYSQIKVIKSALTAKVRRSSVDREEYLKELLHKHGDAIYIIQLQGYLFFGNTNSVTTTIMQRLQAVGLTQIRYLILDFKEVPSMDSSSSLSLLKLSNFTQLSNVQTIFTGISKEITETLPVELKENKKTRFFNTLDRGLAWSEEMFLNEITSIGKPSTTLQNALLPFALQCSDIQKLVAFFDSNTLPEEYIFISQGSPSSDMYFIESGTVEIFLTSPMGVKTRLRTLSAGVIVGEIGLYLDLPRTASVKTKTVCTIWHLSLEKLNQLEIEEPELASILHHYVACQNMVRLNYANELVSALQDGR